MSEGASVSQQMADLIARALDEEEGDVIPSQLASEVLRWLRDDDPDLLTSWLELHAEAILREQITGQLRVRRARSRKKAEASVFARAAKAFEAGDTTALSTFEVRYVVDGADTQRRVRDMTRSDCLFVAERYSLSSDRLALLAAFQRAVASKVGDKTVGEVYTENEYDRLYRSIVKQPPAIAV